MNRNRLSGAVKVMVTGGKPYQKLLPWTMRLWPVPGELIPQIRPAPGCKKQQPGVADWYNSLMVYPIRNC